MDDIFTEYESLYFGMAVTVVRQRFSTANEKTAVVETNPQIDSRFAAGVTLVTSLHNKDAQSMPNKKAELSQS